MVISRLLMLGSHRDWVLNHAREQVLLTFNQLKTARYEAHLAYLQTLPCYALYQKFHGNPPLQAQQFYTLQTQINHAQGIYKAGVDEDWRRSCLRYPEVLDYYFSLVEVSLPDDKDSVMREPRFGAALKETRRIKARRGSRGSGDFSNGHRKNGRRRTSRGRTPPQAPMASAFRR